MFIAAIFWLVFVLLTTTGSFALSVYCLWKFVSAILASGTEAKAASTALHARESRSPLDSVSPAPRLPAEDDDDTIPGVFIQKVGVCS